MLKGWKDGSCSERSPGPPGLLWGTEGSGRTAKAGRGGGALTSLQRFRSGRLILSLAPSHMLFSASKLFLVISENQLFNIPHLSVMYKCTSFSLDTFLHWLMSSSLRFILFFNISSSFSISVFFSWGDFCASAQKKESCYSRKSKTWKSIDRFS